MILALLVGGPVRTVIAGCIVLSPLLLLGWLGVAIIAAAVVGAAVWVARRQWWGRPW